MPSRSTVARSGLPLTTKPKNTGASAPADDPTDFAAVCQLLGTIRIGDAEFPIDIPALDTWIAAQPLPAETLAEWRAVRGAAVDAYVARDDDQLRSRLQEMHRLAHMLRALPLAGQGARESARNAENRAGKGADKGAVKRRHAKLAAEGDYDPTSQTAAEFGISTRRVRQILKE